MRLFPLGYELNCSVLIPTESTRLPELAELIIERLLPPELLSGKEVRDVKGASEGGSEVALLIEGGLTSDTEVVEPFQLWIQTRFKAFEGAHHIIHSSTISGNGMLFDLISPHEALHEIGRLLPIRLRRLRVGLEFFRSRVAAMIGFTPTICGGLEINADERQIAIALHGDALKRGSNHPLRSSPIREELEAIFLKMCGISISEEIRRSLP